MNTAEAIHRNPAAVRAVIAEARENEDIPTKTAVLNKIRYEKEKERAEKAKDHTPPKFVLNLEQEKYINALYGIIDLLPSSPPKNWNEKSFAHAQGLVKVIRKRLEAFDGNAKAYIA